MSRSDRGSAMLLCLVILIVIVGISGAYLSFSLINNKRTSDEIFALQAVYVAEAGAGVYINNLNNGTALATVPNPVTYGGGEFTVPVVLEYGTDNEDNDGDGNVDNQYEQNFVRIEVEGTFSGMTRKLEIILNRSAGGAFWNAVFAGNSSGDTGYDLSFGGTSGSYDVIQGNIYSGNNVTSGGHAQLLNEAGTSAGAAMVNGTFTDTSTNNTDPAVTQGTQNELDFTPGTLNPNITNYEEQAKLGTSGYIDVSGRLNSYGTQGYGSSGTSLGEAEKEILNQADPAHMWRKNPATNGNSLSGRDRTVDYADVDTAKDDYYLEDPTVGYRNLTLTPAVNGSSAAHVNKLSPTGNNQVYFIDGNMWMSHDGILNFKFEKPDPNTAMAITIVVKGNINFTDNMLYDDNTMDGVALIAIEDDDPRYRNTTPSEFDNGANQLPNGQTVSDWLDDADDYNSDLNGLDLTDPADRAIASQEYNRANGSGNIYYGDPGSGTVDYFEGYMYAQNNFYATGIDAAAGNTDRVHILGNMTAGNHVIMDRDTSQGYKALEVILDPKVKDGTINLPDLPSTPGTGDGDWFIASWKLIP